MGKSLIFAAVVLLSGCSMIDKAVNNVGTALQGSGGAGAGAAIGCSIGGPIGCITGAMMGGATGAVVADKTIDQKPPTAMDLIEQLLDLAGWGLLLVFLLPWVIGLFHEKPTLKKKPTELGSRAG